jgi:hypothetical protein
MIENENINYQEILSETLKEVKENPEIGEFINRLLFVVFT